MKTIIANIRAYFYETDDRILAGTTIFTGLLVFLNYRYGINSTISDYESSWKIFGARYIVFLVAFGVPWLLCIKLKRAVYQKERLPVALLMLAPLLFAFKTVFDVSIRFSSDNNWNFYWNQVVYWPLLAFFMTAILYLLWKKTGTVKSFYGLTVQLQSWKPYWLMLLIMIPLIAFAASQPDFLEMYPRLKSVTELYRPENLQWWHALIFELSYGFDFFTIELFFRGFLVLAFVQWAGKDVILPMACFYCAIHFGKPVAECISSYFGGILLGIIVYHTRSVIGGLMVHLGIAWMMEIGGYIGNELAK